MRNKDIYEGIAYQLLNNPQNEEEVRVFGRLLMKLDIITDGIVGNLKEEENGNKRE